MISGLASRSSNRRIRSFLLVALAAGTLAPTMFGCASASPPEATEAAAQAESVGGLLTSAPAACVTSPGHYEVFVQSSGNTLWRRPLDNGVWGSWQQITGLDVTSKPACVATASGQVNLFVRGPDGALWQRVRSSTYGAWGSWRSHGGWIADGPSVVSDAPGHLDVFVQGGGNTTYRKKYRAEDFIPPHGFAGGSDGWSDWFYIPGASISSAPSAVSWGPGRIDLFARELGTNNLVHNWSDGAGDWWGGWENKGGYLTSAPSATSRGPGWFAVYVRGGGDLGMHVLPYNTGSGWGTFTPVPLEAIPELPISSDPAAVATSTGCDHIFARDRNNALYHRGCGELNKLKVENLSSGATFETTNINSATYAYDSAAFGAAASGSGSSRFSLIDGRWPRELMVLSRSPHVGDGTSLTGLSYASIPGYQPPTLLPTPDLGPFITSSTTPWIPQAARLIDHGTCATRLPFTWHYVGGVTDSKVAIFSQLSYGIDLGLRRATDQANARGAGVDLYPKESKITPTYLTTAGNTDPGANLDGFTLHRKFEWGKITDFGYASIEFTVDATYQLTMREGMLDVVPVGPVGVGVSTNTLYDLGEFMNPFAQLFGALLGDIINFMPDAAGKDDWVNLVPRTIPSTGSLSDQIRGMFATTLPQTLRAQAMAQLQGVDDRGKPIGVGICRADLDATSQRQFCFDQRTIFMKGAVRDKLIANGMSAAAADARALELTGALKKDSFDCAPVTKDAPEGVCRWHPYLDRVNVLPNRAELVWYDGTTPTADFSVANLFAPPAARALMCPLNTADAVKHDAAPIETISYF